MYDVLVIGAGPAGSAAAYHACRGGLRVLIVDRVPFPRPKPCGDALSSAALGAIRRLGVQSLRGHPVRGMRLFAGSSCSGYEDFSTHGAPRSGLVVSRATLDRLLLERARAAGAEFRVTRAQSLLWCRERVIGAVLETPRGPVEVTARAVVGAGGSSGLTGLLGARARDGQTTWGTAGRTYLATRSCFGDELEVYFPISHAGRLLFGYGWLFPAGRRRINAGVGLVRTADGPAVSVSLLLEHFLRARTREDSRLAGAVRCAPVARAPIAAGPILDVVPGFLPVGDLAGLANPFTGEGIASALRSGELAAQAILADGEDAGRGYSERLRRHLPSRLSLKGGSVADIYESPGLFLGRGADAITAAAGSSSAALRQLIWDDPGSDVPHTLESTASGSAVGMVRDELIRAMRRLRPLLAEILARMLAAPRVGFGWYTAFGAAVWRAQSQHEDPLPPEARAVLGVLESVDLVSVLHSELLPLHPARPSRNVWGQNTLSLVLADCLTAHTLRVLYGLRRPWARALGGLARQTLRREAERGLTSLPKATKFKAFVMAARAGAGCGPGHSLAPAILLTVKSLAALKAGRLDDGAAAVAAARAVLTHVPERERLALTALLDAAEAHWHRYAPQRPGALTAERSPSGGVVSVAAQ